MWKIDTDNIAEPDEESRVGYSEAHSRIPVSMAAIGYQSEELPSHFEGEELDGKPSLDRFLPLVTFRLKDDDGEVYYEGVLHDDDDCENQEAALAFGMHDAGACIIEVKRNGKWVQEIG